MKNKLLKSILFCLFLSLVFSINAQDKDFNIYHLGNCTIEIDGEKDDVWDKIWPHDISVAWKDEQVSMQSETTPTFKAVYNSTSLFILIEVPDDDFFPSIESGAASWLSDKPEINLDVNSTLIDGGGPSDDPGHYQFAPGFMDTVYNNLSWVNKCKFAYDNSIELGDDTKEYFVEYKIPLDSLLDSDGIACDGSRDIGFDITIIDLDETGKGITTEEAQRINYCNDASVDETWNAMDYSAKLTFMYGWFDCSSSVSSQMDIDLDIYPNPTNVNFTISAKQVIRKVKLLDMLGHVVETLEPNSTQVKVDISDLCTGIYIVKVKTAYGWASEYLIVE